MIQVVREDTAEYSYFTQSLLTMVLRRMGKEYSATIYKVTKNNSLVLDSLVLLKEGKNFAPNIYLQPYYEAYQQGVGMGELVQRLCTIYETHNKPMVSDKFSYTYEEMKGRVIFRLVNYERNRKLLEKVPHVKYMDLAITYHCLVHDEQDGIGTIRITNEHIKHWKVGLREIHELAAENTERLFPPDLHSMNEIISGMGEAIVDNEVISSHMYILSNRQGINGATCLLYQEVLKQFAERLHSDFYLFPSSIHEVILVPCSDLGRSREYSAMVREINETQVAAEEILSDSVYYYSTENGLVILE